jgi:hypothetical protein
LFCCAHAPAPARSPLIPLIPTSTRSRVSKR